MTAHRLQWAQLPEGVRVQVEGVLGARVVSSTSGAGGYSPSLASRCDLDDGRRVFVKAVSPAQNPESPGMLRREVEITRVLPSTVPAPRLLHALDDGRWVVGVFEYVDGRPPHNPWDPTELASVLSAVSWIGAAPISEDLRALVPRAEHEMARLFDKWQLLADARPNTLDPLGLCAPRRSRPTRGWLALRGFGRVTRARRHPQRQHAPRTIRACHLRRLAAARIGASWIDFMWMLPSISLEGGGTPEDVLRRHSLGADDAAINAVVAAMAGFFIWQGGRPDPPGLPTVRAFQRAQAEVALR